MYLDDRDNRTDEMQALRPNGFTEETVISDFPVRDKKLTCTSAAADGLHQRSVISAILHVQAMQALRIVSHGTLLVTP